MIQYVEMLVIIPVLMLVCKIFDPCNLSNIDKLFKLLYTGALCVLVVALAKLTASVWGPYILHCLTKVNQSDVYPGWCADSAFPSQY